LVAAGPRAPAPPEEEEEEEERELSLSLKLCAIIKAVYKYILI
jgi:hypothetical protein